MGELDELADVRGDDAELVPVAGVDAAFLVDGLDVQAASSPAAPSARAPPNIRRDINGPGPASLVVTFGDDK